jgi:hypothetical protein
MSPVAYRSAGTCSNARRPRRRLQKSTGALNPCLYNERSRPSPDLAAQGRHRASKRRSPIPFSREAGEGGAKRRMRVRDPAHPALGGWPSPEGQPNILTDSGQRQYARGGAKPEISQRALNYSKKRNKKLETFLVPSANPSDARAAPVGRGKRGDSLRPRYPFRTHAYLMLIQYVNVL